MRFEMISSCSRLSGIPPILSMCAFRIAHQRQVAAWYRITSLSRTSAEIIRWTNDLMHVSADAFSRWLLLPSKSRSVRCGIRFCRDSNQNAACKLWPCLLARLDAWRSCTRTSPLVRTIERWAREWRRIVRAWLGTCSITRSSTGTCARIACNRYKIEYT